MRYRYIIHHLSHPCVRITNDLNHPSPVPFIFSFCNPLSSRGSCKKRDATLPPGYSSLPALWKKRTPFLFPRGSRRAVRNPVIFGEIRAFYRCARISDFRGIRRRRRRHRRRGAPVRSLTGTGPSVAQRQSAEVHLPIHLDSRRRSRGMRVPVCGPTALSSSGDTASRASSLNPDDQRRLSSSRAFDASTPRHPRAALASSLSAFCLRVAACEVYSRFFSLTLFLPPH